MSIAIVVEACTARGTRLLAREGHRFLGVKVLQARVSDQRLPRLLVSNALVIQWQVTHVDTYSSIVVIVFA